MFAAILRLRPGHRSGTQSPARFTRLTCHWRRERDGRLSRHWYLDPSWPGEPGADDLGLRSCRQESCREHA
jgi:hypothetical protein